MTSPPDRQDWITSFARELRHIDDYQSLVDLARREMAARFGLTTAWLYVFEREEDEQETLHVLDRFIANQNGIPAAMIPSPIRLFFGSFMNVPNTTSQHAATNTAVENGCSGVRNPGDRVRFTGAS